MGKILIVGQNSYIGRNLKNWLGKYPDKYSIDLISLRNDLWRDIDFSVYDVVIHVAGIAHIKETKENKHLYYKVNRDLSFEVAKKAKLEGVKQFIFFSSMSVYGIESGNINNKSKLNPKSNYGKSKLQAEILIETLRDYNFKVAIIRPPMVYGEDCKGNYAKLVKLSNLTPVFPYIENQRSMIYIKNLCEFIRIIIDDCSSGLFFPQNKDYVCTSEMVKLIAQAQGRKIRFTKLFNFIISILRFGIVKKVFGNLVYDKSLSKEIDKYNKYTFKESI